MAAPDAPKPNGTVLTSLSPVADVLSKATAGIVIAVYACGFLIVSLYHARYGFTGANPFRPRNLAAGAWFMFFSGVPITVAIAYRDKPWKMAGRSLLLIWAAFMSISFPISSFLFNYETGIVLPSKSMGILGAGVFVLYLVANNWKRVPETVTLIASVTFVAYLCVVEIRQMAQAHAFEFNSLTLWFFGVFLLSLIELKRVANEGFEHGEWAKTLGTLFLFLLVFAQYYYPHLRSSWGGGTPVDVTIYFSKDSVIKPGQVLAAQLVDESDDGFYLLGVKETKAVYVPRSQVALVYFSDNPNDSALLRGASTGRSP